MKIFYVFTRSAICLQMPLPFDVILVNFSSIVLFSMLLQTCNNSFYCFCLFVYYFGPEVAKSIKIGFYMKGLSMWCPKMIKNHVLGISLLMVSLDFWSEKFDPPYSILINRANTSGSLYADQCKIFCLFCHYLYLCINFPSSPIWKLHEFSLLCSRSWPWYSHTWNLSMSSFCIFCS